MRETLSKSEYDEQMRSFREGGGNEKDFERSMIIKKSV